MEHIKGGELFDYIVSRGRLDRHESLRLTAQIIAGLEHCHTHSICHRDLKPENLLLDDKLNIKIADFGMAQLMKKDTTLKTSCGSPHYASPEIIEGGTYDAKKTDVWSIGVILYALITGSLPFDHDNIPTLLQMVCRGQYTTPAFVHADVSHLISRMLTVDPNRRILLESIKDHAVYKNSKYDYFDTIAAQTYTSTHDSSVDDIPEEQDDDDDEINNNNTIYNIQTPRKRKSDKYTSTRGKRAHNQSLDNNGNILLVGSDNASTHDKTTNHDSSSDTLSDSDVEEQVLKDLESLGWGNTDELRSRVFHKSTQHSTEREFYKLLKRRRHERLQQLSVLSPKISLSRATSAPATAHRNHYHFPFSAVHHHHIIPPNNSSPVINSTAKSPTSMYSSTINTPLQQQTPSSTYQSPAIMPALILTPQTNPIAYSTNTSTIHQRIVPADESITQQQIIGSAVFNKQSAGLPSLELGASAVYKRIADSTHSNSGSDNDIQHNSSSGKPFNTPSLKLVNDSSEADIQVFHEATVNDDNINNITTMSNTTPYPQSHQSREASSTSKPSSRRLFETYRSADISDDDDDHTSVDEHHGMDADNESDNESISQSNTRNYNNTTTTNKVITTSTAKPITPRNSQRISIRVPIDTDYSYRNVAQPTPRFKVTESPRFHRLHYSPESPSTHASSVNSTHTIQSAYHSRHRSEDYTKLPQFIRQNTTPTPIELQHASTNSKITSLNTTNKKKSWFSSLFGKSTLDTIGKTNTSKHSHSDSVDVQPSHTQQYTDNTPNINTSPGLSAVLSDKSTVELTNDIKHVLDRIGVSYTKTGAHTYEIVYDTHNNTNKQHSATPYTTTRRFSLASTSINSPSNKPPTHNRRSTMSTIKSNYSSQSHTPTAKQLQLSTRSRDSTGSSNSSSDNNTTTQPQSHESNNKLGLVGQFVASMKHLLPVTNATIEQYNKSNNNKYSMNDHYSRARSHSTVTPNESSSYNDYSTCVGRHIKQNSEPPANTYMISNQISGNTTPIKNNNMNTTSVHDYSTKSMYTPNTPKHDSTLSHHSKPHSGSSDSSNEQIPTQYTNELSTPVKFTIDITNPTDQYRCVEFQLVDGNSIQYHNLQHTIQTLLGL